MARAPRGRILRGWTGSALGCAVVALAIAGPGLAVGAPHAPAAPEAAAGPGRSQGPAADAKAATGAFLYGRDCSWCHGPAGEGTARGPSFRETGEAAQVYMLESGRMPIAAPDQRITRREPPYTRAELDALIAHAARFGDGEPLPDVDVAAADVARGGSLYRLHCAACHGATGIGGALVGDAFAPSVMPSEPEVIAAAIVTGPGAMPAFQLFDDGDLAAVVAYTRYLQDADHRGGAPLAGAGRVDEGIVGMAAAGLLALGAAWIATRARRA